jgi:hypothetical protein
VPFIQRFTVVGETPMIIAMEMVFRPRSSMVSESRFEKSVLKSKKKKKKTHHSLHVRRVLPGYDVQCLKFENMVRNPCKWGIDQNTSLNIKAQLGM